MLLRMHLHLHAGVGLMRGDGKWATVHQDGGPPASTAMQGRHNDMHRLQTNAMDSYYPSLRALDLAWNEISYASFVAGDDSMVGSTSSGNRMGGGGESGSGEEHGGGNETRPTGAGHALSEASVAYTSGGGGADGLATSSDMDSRGGGMGMAAAEAVLLKPALAPRARSGHTLTVIGMAADGVVAEGSSHLVLVGGEAATRVDYPVAERFLVHGVQSTRGALVPHARGHGGDAVNPPTGSDPVTASYTASGLALSASDDSPSDLPPDEYTMDYASQTLSGAAQTRGEGADSFAAVGLGGAEAAGLKLATGGFSDSGKLVASVAWQIEPTWVVETPVTRYDVHAVEVVTHTTHGQVSLLRDDLDTADAAVHTASELYVQQTEQLADVHVFDAESESWVQMVPSGDRFLSRTGHAACAFGNDSIAVFGGWRLRPCAQSLPCGEFLADLHVLHMQALDAAGEPPPGADKGQGNAGAGQAGDTGIGPRRTFASQWEQPLVDGTPPLPRRGHSLTSMPAALSRNEDVGRGVDRGLEDGHAMDEGAVMLFGLAWLWNSTTQQGRGLYLNDVHLLTHLNSTWSWRYLYVEGSPPAPRAGHSATFAPDGQRLIVFGGMNADGPMADAHILDLSQLPPVWWQLLPIGEAPKPRYAHTAALFGADLMIVGGMPLEGGGSTPLELLNLLRLEMQTSAVIADRLQSDALLNASCSLLGGSYGSPVQRYTCSPMSFGF